MIENFKSIINELEEEIEGTKERLIKIMKPYYIMDFDEVIKIHGVDLLFYGECCKREARLQTAKQLKELVEKAIDNSQDGWITEDRLREDTPKKIKIAIAWAIVDYKKFIKEELRKALGVENEN